MAVRFADALLARNVGAIIGEQEVGIAATAQECLNDVTEKVPIVRAEKTVADLIECSTQLGILMVIALRGRTAA